MLSVCNGAFVLGAAGLLDGRRCTTHWRHAAALARLFPDAKVDPAVLYVDEGPVITSAGTAAGIDDCLYLVRSEQGSRIANGIARRMVVRRTATAARPSMSSGRWPGRPATRCRTS